MDDAGSIVSSCTGTHTYSSQTSSRLTRPFHTQLMMSLIFSFTSFFFHWLLVVLSEIHFLSLSVAVCFILLRWLGYLFRFPHIEHNAALKQLVSTSTLVFLTSAAGPPVATAAALLPFSDGRNNSSNCNRSSQPMHNRKYPLLKRESSISLESASALINSHGSVPVAKQSYLFCFPSCVFTCSLGRLSISNLLRINSIQYVVSTIF